MTESSTPEHFPKPFQNRPPGQFHLPWSPTTSTRLARTSLSSLRSTGSSAPGGPEHFTVKAIMQDAIVLLRAAHGMPLADLRARLRDKFLSEGVRLTDAFTVGFSPPAPAPAMGGGRPRSQSTSSVSSAEGHRRLRFITNDADWEQAAAGCTGKLTIHVFDRF